MLFSDGYLQNWATKEAIEEKKRKLQLQVKNEGEGENNGQIGFEFVEMKNNPKSQVEYF